MHKRTLLARGLRHYRRTHLGVLAGTMVAAAVLTGALILGDSVRHTLRQQALLRIGDIDFVIAAGDRFFGDDLGTRLRDAGPTVQHAASVVQVLGVAARPDGQRTARNVNVLGVDAAFYGFAPGPMTDPSLRGDRALLSQSLANRLQCVTGEEIVIRVQRPGVLPGDSVLATTDDTTLSLRVTVAGVVDDQSFGRFSLRADQLPPLNLFVPLETMQAAFELDGRANVLLLDTADPDDLASSTLDATVDVVFEPRDAELEVVAETDSTSAELRSRRIFLDPVVATTVQDNAAHALGILTYFVNGIEHGESSTPYSMVTAYGGLSNGDTAGQAAPLPDDLADDEIVINTWLADDLGCGPGDELTLRYSVLDDTDTLVEDAASFRIRSIVGIEGFADDRGLMPEYPGIAEAESSRDWSPGIPIDLGRIRDKDEAYWDERRGTPKAFVTLAAGQRLWGNRYGDLTAIRVPASDADGLRETLRTSLDPAALGLNARAVRGPALAASAATSDFGGLFLGLSFFLITAALVLTGLLFVFNVEQRTREIGVLLAMGFRPKDVRRLLLGEGLVIAGIGSVIGAVVGIAYTRAILAALSGVWADAVASAAIELHVAPLTVLMGATISVLVALFAMWMSLGRAIKRDPTALLADTPARSVTVVAGRRRLASLIVAVVTIGGAIGLAATTDGNARDAAPTFFGAGALMLVGLIAVSYVVLAGHRGSRRLTLDGLAVSNATRRRSRSLGTVTLLACGVFLVLAIGVNQLDANKDATERSSGTGGFAFIGDSTLRVHLDLNRERGREVFGLDDATLDDVRFVSMRSSDGDDASCLNLNRAPAPRILGVDPDALASRGAFTFARATDDATRARGWEMLRAALPDGSIPVVADDASATWAMHRAVGETFDILDERGEPRPVTLVGTVANSILQGALLMDETRFRDLFPSEDGARRFLVDAPADQRDAVAARLERAMSDVGLELTPATERLAAFSAVQNTYLSIFQILGGLGVLLGTIGLGVVVVRNILERRTELAILRAVGFRLGAIRRLVFAEHVLLLALGLAGGAGAALVAILPTLRSPTASFPVGLAAAGLAGLLLNGLVWIWVATRLSITGRIAETMGEDP